MTQIKTYTALNCRYARTINNTPDWISERPPRSGLFLCHGLYSCKVALTVGQQSMEDYDVARSANDQSAFACDIPGRSARLPLRRSGVVSIGAGLAFEPHHRQIAVASGVASCLLMIAAFGSAYLGFRHEPGAAILFTVSLGLFTFSLIYFAREVRIAMNHTDFE